MSLQKMNTIHHLQNHEPEVHYPCTADDYDILQEIGIGAFATVYRATVIATGEEVAIKIIDLEQFNTNW
jgi:serine/threonine protein kinase